MVEFKTPQVLVFDFDGVLLESVDVKDEAFRELFPETTAEQRQAVYDFHRATPGIHRRVKVTRILTEVLQRPADESTVEGALERFQRVVWERLMECPEVPGVRAFLEAHEHLPKYVVSAAPHDELRKLAQARDFTRYFRDVLGSPPGKVELLHRIVRWEGVAPAAATMYGDKLTDLHAAEDVGVHFVGRRASHGPAEFPSGASVIDSFIELGPRRGYPSSAEHGKGGA